MTLFNTLAARSFVTLQRSCEGTFARKRKEMRAFLLHFARLFVPLHLKTSTNETLTTL